MIDLFHNNNLEKSFSKFVNDDSDESELSIVNHILTEDEDAPSFDEEQVKQEMIKFSVDCMLKPEKFDFNPGQTTALYDTFLGVKKGCNHGPLLKHIIYINPAMADRVSFVKKFLNVCERMGIDFDFEYTLNSHATNGVTIYATDEQLAKYRQALNTLATECPQLVNRCRKTPLNATKLGWYGYQPLSNRVVPAVYAGFAKSLIDYYTLVPPQKILQKNFGEELYNVCTQKNDVVFGSFVVDEFVKNRFVKYQDKILESITKKGISLNDIVSNVQLKLPKELGVESKIKVTVGDFIHVLRMHGVNIESYTQKNMFASLLKENTQKAMAKFGIIASLPTALVGEKTEQKVGKVAEISFKPQFKKAGHPVSNS